MDIEARDLSGRLASQVAPLATRAIGAIGTRIFGGRIFNAKTVDATGTTWEVLCGLASPFEAVRIVFAAGNTPSANAIAPSVVASAAALGAADDATSAAVTPTSVTVAGAGTFSLSPSAGATSRRWLLSDWIPLPSVARTDGGGVPLLAIRAWTFMPAGQAGTIVVLGNGTQDFSNWGAHPSGRVWRMRSKGAGYVGGSWSGMTGANASVANGCPIVGVQYLARGKVVSVMGFGDSITEWQGTYIGEGFGLPACLARTGSAGVAWEWSNCGWAGQGMAAIRANLADVLAAGLVPDVAVLACGSQNDPTAGAIPATGAGSPTAQRGQLGLMLAALSAQRVEPVLWTWLPTATSVRAYGASDALRRAYNDEIRGWAKRGTVFADFDSVLAGVADASGQVQAAAGMMPDGIHPGDAGNARLAAVLARALGRAVQVGEGLLAA